MNTFQRVLLFVTMVGTGLLLTLLLADEKLGAARTDKRIATTPSQPAGDALRVAGAGDRGDAIDVLFPDELVVGITGPVEVAPGQVEEREIYRVHMQRAGPEGDEFLAHDATVYLLDETTGAEDGWLRADEARFELTASLAGTAAIDPTALGADDFYLEGDVRGELPMDDGERVRLSASRLDVHGERITGPGLVTWTRDDMSLEGHDFSWDGAIGRVHYVRDAVIRVEPAEGRPGVDLFAPGGLTWTFPPDAENAQTASWGELRGRVSGVATDGSRLGADTVAVRESTVQLHGASVYERREQGGLERITARHITVRLDDAGVFAFAEADGNVRVLSAPFAVVPSWMVTEHLVMHDDVVTAPGEVAVGNEDALSTGSEASWDRRTGTLRYARDAALTFDAEGEPPLAGLRVQGPGGMTLVVPPDSGGEVAMMTGEVRGRVKGALADGTTFAADLLTLDGPGRTLTLEGDSWIEQPAPGDEPDAGAAGTGLEADTLAGGETETDAGSRRVEARRITFTADEGGELALVTASGDVVLLSTPVEMLPTRIVTSELSATREEAHGPGVVQWTRGDLTVIGTDVTWHGKRGRLTCQRDALLTLHDPERQLELELAGAGGLDWFVPADAIEPFEDGRGELRGPVTGRTSDGSSLSADKLLVDGPTRTLMLLGDASLEWHGDGDPLRLTSLDGLTVEGLGESAVRAHTEAPVRWSRRETTGRGVGLRWDEAAGRLVVLRDVELRLVDPERGRQVDLYSDGPLTWNVGTEAGGTGARLSSGSMRERVRGVVSDGGRFASDALVFDETTRRLRLDGNAHYERKAADGSLWLEAADFIELELDAAGEVRWLEASRDVEGWLWPTDAVGPDDPATRLSGRHLLVDRTARQLTLSGDAVTERREEGRVDRIEASDRIELHTDARDEVERIVAVDDVVCTGEKLSASCRRLDWNLASDLATLEGRSRLRTEGGWMEAEFMRFRPEAEELEMRDTPFDDAPDEGP